MTIYEHKSRTQALPTTHKTAHSFEENTVHNPFEQHSVWNHEIETKNERTQSGEKRMVSAVQEGHQELQEKKNAHQQKKERRGEEKKNMWRKK